MEDTGFLRIFFAIKGWKMLKAVFHFYPFNIVMCGSFCLL